MGTDSGRSGNSILVKVFNGIAAATMLFVILYITKVFLRFGWIIEQRVFLAVVLMVGLMLIFAFRRVKKGDKSVNIPWYDYLFMAASIASIGYMVVNYDTVFAHIGKAYISPLEKLDEGELMSLLITPHSISPPGGEKLDWLSLHQGERIVGGLIHHFKADTPLVDGFIDFFYA